MSDTRDTDVFRWLLLAAIIVVVGGVGLYVFGMNSPTQTAQTPAVTEPAQPQKPAQTPPMR